MPEMRFDITWPDGTSERCYSPSLIIKDYFAPGDALLVDDFLVRSREALGIASARVKAKYGMPCSRALSQLARLEAGCEPFKSMPGATIRIERFDD